jgi:hypothetical protein
MEILAAAYPIRRFDFAAASESWLGNADEGKTGDGSVAGVWTLRPDAATDQRLAPFRVELPRYWPGAVEGI